MAKKKLLIVEDDSSLLKALISKFENQEGLEVLFAKNGEEGLAVALHDHPNMILLDIVMPRMDGMTMLNKLRKDKWGKKATVVFLTNLSDSENINKANKEGVYDYLVKSDWKIYDVFKLVKKKLNIK